MPAAQVAEEVVVAPPAPQDGQIPARAPAAQPSSAHQKAVREKRLPQALLQLPRVAWVQAGGSADTPSKPEELLPRI
ncbi:MAG: hypothetical protein SGI92_27090 [Bryobacteraceae bacterium]|nr:hypothetical protein [Bryobacteraceae bacterium]